MIIATVKGWTAAQRLVAIAECFISTKKQNDKLRIYRLTVTDDFAKLQEQIFTVEIPVTLAHGQDIANSLPDTVRERVIRMVMYQNGAIENSYQCSHGNHIQNCQPCLEQYLKKREEERNKIIEEFSKKVRKE